MNKYLDVPLDFCLIPTKVFQTLGIIIDPGWEETSLAV